VVPPVAIIINNAAARVRNSWPKIKDQLDLAGVDYEALETTAPGDASQLCRRAIENGRTLIGVIGGDGTLSEAAAGYFEVANDRMVPINSEAAMAILPAGTGNDFARTLAGERLPVDHWLKLFVRYCREPAVEQTQVVDVIRARTDNLQRQSICINASTLGMGGETASRVAAQGSSMRRLSGETRFVAAALGALAAWRERPVKVTIDDKTIEGPMNLIAVANARFAGGGMMLSPAAQLEDGLLDVVTVSGLTRREILRELTRIHKGGHVANPKVKIIQGAYVRIETLSADDAMLIEVDGNVSGRTPAEYEIVPTAMRVVRGRQ